MATYWVDFSKVDDSGDGLTAGTAKKNWDAGIALATATGDIVNVINSTPIVVPSAAVVTITGKTGASFASPGFTIQGTDSSGNPALTEVRFQDNATAQNLLTVGANNSFIIFQNFHVNWNPNTTAATTKRIVQRSASTGTNIRVTGCWFEGKSNVGGQIYSETSTTLTGAGGEVSYCFIDDTHTSLQKMTPGPRSTASFHNNVIVTETGGGTAQTIFDMGSDDTATTDHRFYNNTIVVRATAASSIILPVLSDDTSASGAPVKHNHSNIYANYLTGVNSYRYMNGPGGTPSSAAYTRVIGYNVFYLPGALSYASANGPYWRPWDEDDDDTAGEPDYWATDNVSTVNNPFNDDATSWDWEVPSGVTITLPGDFRVTEASGLRATGLAGVVPGAIEDAVLFPEISTADLSMTANIGNPVTENVVINNTGTGTLTIASLVFASSSATLTYGGAASGSVPAGDSLLLPITFAPTLHPTDVTATLTITSDDEDEPVVVVNITARSVADFTPGGPPLSEDNPGYYLPPFSGVTASIELHKNTSFWARFMAEVGGADDLAVGIAAGTFQLATSSGLISLAGLSLTGLNKIFVMVKGGPVNLQVGSSEHVLLDGGCLLIANTTNLSTVLIENTSTIREVEVHFFGSKGS